MFRWLLGSKEPQGGVEKTTVLNIGEEQIQNPYTELSALKSHNDIVRFLVQVDENRFASAGDDGSVMVWDVQTGEVLYEFHGHTQKITAIAVFPTSESYHMKTDLILTASSDKTVIAWDCESGLQWQKASNFHSTVKALLIVQSLDVWLSGGSEFRVWNRNFNLLGEAGFFSDGGIVALIELPKHCVAAAVGKDLIIFKIGTTVPGLEKLDIFQIKRLSGHQDVVRTVINVNEMTFVSSCDAGELIVWDALDFSIQGCERNFPHMYAQQDSPPESRLLPTQEEVSIQHLSSDGEYVYVAVGRGIYVYNLHTKRVIAFQSNAHDSSIQHMANIPSRQLVSCSEDGSVRIWELRLKPQLHGESVPAGFFTMWGFGKGSKQYNQTVKKTNDDGIVASLNLIGDLIGHSSSVQMFLHFQDHGLVTCSADQLIILWKEGKRESRIRSLMLFQKLEQNGDLQPRYSLH
ncbi:PREDICTED: WD repeat-containing protein 41 [Nanorana parkeri]|uniref:WD repeat-containing protein 41 n=1 Tax=Nanorana parkeri TaxID=125878 RepID=UPI00085457B1|nr:PREDICTED: WD repeat-containing protein 41 [Nanorana parkeri]